jgi:hypothetical protein
MAMTRTRLAPRILVSSISMLVLGGTSVAAQSPLPSPPPSVVDVATPGATGSPGPGIAEVALCEMPELAGLGLPRFAVASGADTPPDPRVAVAVDGAGPTGSAGCRAPTQELPDPLGSDAALAMNVVPDPQGDGGLDILGTSWTEVRLDRAAVRRLRNDERIVVTGQRANVLRQGRFALIDVQLGGSPGAGDSINIATDAEGRPARRTPSSVANPVAPLANVRDLYTLHVGANDVRPLASDLSTGEFYTGGQPFAGLVKDRHAVFLIPADGIGGDFRPVTFQAGEGAIPDIAGLGAAPGLLSTSGEFGWIPDCIEQMLIHEPLVLDDVEVSFSTDWVTFCFAASEYDLDLFDEFLEDVEDDEGVAKGLIRFTLVEGGESGEQIRPLDVWIEEDRIYLAFPIGLKAYGYHALRTVEILPTEDPELDDLFAEAAEAIGRRLNPTGFDATAGRLQGDRECAPRPGGS